MKWIKTSKNQIIDLDNLESIWIDHSIPYHFVMTQSKTGKEICILECSDVKDAKLYVDELYKILIARKCTHE